MPEHDEIPLKVTDRRHFNSAGERRGDVADASPESESAAAARSKPAPAAPGAAAPATPPPPASAPPEPSPSEPSQPDPAFVELLESLYATAMLQMGAPAQPGAPPSPPDLVSARQTIEWITALEQKTRGNLAYQEKEFFEGMLYNLRLTYVELTRKLSGQASRPGAGKAPSRK